MHSVTEALAKVEALRAEGKGYGAIAKELGFKLGPVISDAKHTRNAMRKVGKPDAAMKHDHDHSHAHHEKAPKPEKAARPEKPAQPEKMGKPEKPPKP